MIYVIKNTHGEYVFPSPKWIFLYEQGGCVSIPPVAMFEEEKDAKVYLASKNSAKTVGYTTNTLPDALSLTSQSYSCLPDCQFYDGGCNEMACDYCIRKGNIFDKYSPHKRRFA